MLFIKNKALESQRGINMELSGSEQGMGPMNKEERVVSQPSTVLAAMMNLKQKDVLVEHRNESGVQLICIGKEAYET